MDKLQRKNYLHLLQKYKKRRHLSLDHLTMQKISTGILNKEPLETSSVLPRDMVQQQIYFIKLEGRVVGHHRNHIEKRKP